MRQTPWLYPSQVLATLFLALLAACSRDTPRENPLDPSLTPSVEIAVAVDDTAGTATVSWTPYGGSSPFARYIVLRNAFQSTQVETLATVPNVHQTSYVDSAIRAGAQYEYRVLVENEGGLAEGSIALPAPSLGLPPVNVTTEFNPVTASAEVRWSPYAGPRFQAYEVRRRTRDLASRTVATLGGISDTTWTATGLVGNTEYFYHVVVVTDREEEVASAEASGVIYRHEVTWPVDVPSRPFVRLAVGSADTLSALVWYKPDLSYWSAELELHGFLQGEGQVSHMALLDSAYVLSGAHMAFAPMGAAGLFVALSWWDAAAGGPLITDRVLGICQGPMSCDLVTAAEGVQSLEWISATTASGTTLLTVDAVPYTLQGNMMKEAGPAFESRVRELRAWTHRGRTWVGVALPDANKLLLGRVPEDLLLDWGTGLSQSLGPGVGDGTPFFSPISFDVGPDGSIYVLDAGHGRIVVFDSNRQYVTQWGEAGDGPLSFGLGGTVWGGDLDYTGSLAVDGHGNVCVSDETGRRIVVFTP